jgi:kynureninase
VKPVSGYQPEESYARHLDATDPLRHFRDEFLLPRWPDGSLLTYLCGHSLGLQPRRTRLLIEQELDDWANLGVEAHFRGKNPWYGAHEQFRDLGARLVGARPGEVVMMNSLTVNLHLMLTTFYRPRADRACILIDEPAFPSDLYAVQSQLRLHGFDPAHTLRRVQPRPGEHTLHEDAIEALIDQQRDTIAVVLLNGVNFVTGQWLDMPRLTAAAHRHGIPIGFDLAHAAGNVPLQLHDWDVDFAVWCSYKYLNSGPGAVGGCFVHEKHGKNTQLPRLAGWWGNDPATRFQMHTQREFVPRAGADGWQISNPPILALTPLRASLDLFDAAGMLPLRAKSERLTGYLEYLLDRLPPGRVEIITPREPRRRGCALSLLVRDRPRELFQQLEQQGVVCDFREPNVIRAAAVPLYNTFHEVWTFARTLADGLEQGAEA